MHWISRFAYLFMLASTLAALLRWPPLIPWKRRGLRVVILLACAAAGFSAWNAWISRVSDVHLSVYLADIALLELAFILPAWRSYQRSAQRFQKPT